MFFMLSTLYVLLLFLSTSFDIFQFASGSPDVGTGWRVRTANRLIQSQVLYQLR